VNPTEDLEKVKKAVENIAPTSIFKTISHDNVDTILAKAEDKAALAKLHALLRQERILDAARKVLRSGTSGKKITFYLNKQVAYAGHISLCAPEGESPLGPIKLEISCDDPKQVIDWLAPRTTKR
jgi:hypothetical protein